MSKELLRQRMIGILRSMPCRRIDFRVGGFRADPAGYEKIARLLGRRGPIKVDIEPNDEGIAFYDSKTNTVSFPEPGYGRSVGERALIVHELTHALEDERRRTMGELELEVAAYVAGSLYAKYARQQSPGVSLSWPSRGAVARRSGRAQGLILVDADGTPIPTREQQTERLKAAVHAAADSLAGHPGAALSAPYYQAVASAVRDHEVYEGATDKKTKTFDGIR